MDTWPVDVIKEVFRKEVSPVQVGSHGRGRILKEDCLVGVARHFDVRDSEGPAFAMNVGGARREAPWEEGVLVNQFP